MSVAVRAVRGKNGGKIFHDNLQACYLMLRLWSISNLCYN